MARALSVVCLVAAISTGGLALARPAPLFLIGTLVFLGAFLFLLRKDRRPHYPDVDPHHRQPPGLL